MRLIDALVGVDEFEISIWSREFSIVNALRTANCHTAKLFFVKRYGQEADRTKYLSFGSPHRVFACFSREKYKGRTSKSWDRVEKADEAETVDSVEKFVDREHCRRGVDALNQRVEAVSTDNHFEARFAKRAFCRRQHVLIAHSQQDGIVLRHKRHFCTWCISNVV